MTIVHHEGIRRRQKPHYTSQDILELRAFLSQSGTFHFTPLATGLFPAAAVDARTIPHSGYDNVWVRDNVYVALAHMAGDRWPVAVTVATVLATYFDKHRHRFCDVITGHADPHDPMNRPQVRFNGKTLSERTVRWSHAQNDALGYFLFLYCRVAITGRLRPDGELLALFVLFFEAIRYWEDPDNGHWEETRKVEASSIGVVVAGLRQVRALLATFPTMECRWQTSRVSTGRLDELIEQGEAALGSILPAESITPGSARRYDSALLFLLYPLDVVDGPMARQIFDDVSDHLLGDYGIRRYLGDSYWTADYKDKVAPQDRTADVSEHQQQRDALARPGEEAQWCIFDPIMSIIAGRFYGQSGDPVDRDRQVFHLNRALGQITGPDCPLGELRCPEAYFKEQGRYVPNDHVPLLWTQANLWLALVAMGP